jgi:hypothetical protein
MRGYILKSIILIVFVGFSPVCSVAQQTSNILPCPTIKVSCPDTTDEYLAFSAQVLNADLHTKITFSWTVSAGVITDGQGTNSITIDTSEAAGRTVTAKVTVFGLPSSCPTEASCSTAVIRDPIAQKLDEYGDISFSDEKAHLDSFASKLAQDPGAQGYILVYAGRRARAGEAQVRAGRAKQYLVDELGLDERRIVVVDGGHRDELTVELFIVTTGASPPAATPTIDPNGVQIIKDNGKRVKRRGKP